MINRLFISEIRDLIAEGRIDKALEDLLRNKEVCQEYVNDLILLKSRFSTNQRNDQILGIMAQGESNNIVNQVGYAILEILKKSNIRTLN